MNGEVVMQSSDNCLAGVGYVRNRGILGMVDTLLTILVYPQKPIVSVSGGTLDAQHFNF